MAVNTIPAIAGDEIIDSLLDAGCTVVDANYNTDIGPAKGKYISGRPWLTGQSIDPLWYFTDKKHCNISEIEDGFDSFKKRTAAEYI